MTTPSSWRGRPETTQVIAQSKRAIEELLATAAELDRFVTALLQEMEEHDQCSDEGETSR
jgi:hypothetical protein